MRFGVLTTALGGACIISLSGLSACGEDATTGSSTTTTVIQEKTSSTSWSGLDSVSAIGSTVARLNWTHHTDSQLYLIYNTTSGTPQLVASVSPPTATYNVTGLSPTTSYSFRTRLMDSEGLQDANTNDLPVTTGAGDCYQSEVLTDSPVLYLPMDESSGTTATDLGSAANDGTYDGTFTLGAATPIATATSGSAVTFDGTTANIALGNPAALQITGDQTIELWLKPASFNARRNPWAKSYGGEGTMTVETNRTINYYYGTGGNNTSPYQGFGTSSTLTLDTWTHVVLVRDLTNTTLRWYFNGVEVNSTTANYNPAVTSTLDAYVGRGYVSAFHGDIDEVAVYNTALSPTRIQAHYDAATTCP